MQFEGCGIFIKRDIQSRGMKMVHIGNMPHMTSDPYIYTGATASREGNLVKLI